MSNIENTIARIEDLERIIDAYGSSYAYEFDITLPNGQKVGKVGDTNAPLRRMMEWAKVYKDWFEVKFSYLGTTDIDKDTFFRDFSIHAYGKQHLGWKQVPRADFPADKHYTQEAFYGATAENVAAAVKQLREDIREGKATVKLYHRKDENDTTDAPTEPFVPRANQQVCIDNIMNAYLHGRHHLLCAAHPRFGKSFTALYALDALGDINFVMVVSAVADAHDEWKDTVNLPNFRNNWAFIDSKQLANGNGHEIADKISDGKKVVVFCTLQDIEGDEKKAKHAEIYKFAKANSFLIVDETHNGGRGFTFSKKIKQLDIDNADALEKEDIDKANDAAINFGFVNQLHLSGTPYRILLTDEFAPEDIVYMASYSDLLADKHAWGVEHADEDERLNPYYEFPERYNFVYDLNQIPDDRLKQFIDEEGLPRLAEIFAVNPDGKFENEELIRSIIKGLYGGFVDKGCWGIFANKTIVKAVKKFHILMKLPSIAACDAFAELIATCDELKDYAIILATSNKRTNPAVKDIKAQVKAADESDKTAGSITLTCQRLSAAVSVKQWNVAINAADGKSAQDYDQFAQRVCTPFSIDFVDDDGNTIKRVEKPNVFVIDLVPERVLSVSMQAAMAKCAARGVSSREDFRDELEKEASHTMTFFVSGIESLKQVSAVDVMDMAANYANASTIDTAVAKVPFCSALFDGATADVLNSLDGEISSAKSFDTKTYEGADDTDVSDKREKLNDADSNDEVAAANSDASDTVDDTKKSDDELRENEAKQRAFFARIGYLSVLANRQFDSLDAMLHGFVSIDGAKTVKNVTGLSLTDCLLVSDAVSDNSRVRIAADNLVYAMTRRMNDENMTREDKLRVFVKSFSKLGESEVITPANVAKLMIDKFGENVLFDIIGKQSRIVELSAETGEFAIALVERFEEMGIFIDEARRVICAVPASPLAYELTKKVYELLGLDTDNIYRFTAYDLLAAIKSDSGNIDETAVKRVSAIMKQAKKPCDITLNDVVEEGADEVNIDAIVGNPPYQISDGGAQASAKPVYHVFSDFAKIVSAISCLIEPARWMTGGKGLNQYRNDMMHDMHIKEIDDFANSKDVFPNVDIKGGVITYLYDNTYNGKCIYTRHQGNDTKTTLRFLYDDGCDVIIRESELTDIYQAIRKKNDSNCFIDSICSPLKPYGLRGEVFGHEDKYHLPKISDIVVDADNGYSILGLDPISKKRTMKYVDRNYPFPKIGNIDKYKLFVPRNYGCGDFGEMPASPVLAEPNMACTETFIELGSFDTAIELNNLYKYFKTKFFRTLVGIKKQDQSASRSIYGFVPLQDFTSSSDIDWTQNVSDIDKQLYSKYGLTNDEIDFIETHVKAMN